MRNPKFPRAAFLSRPHYARAILLPAIFAALALSACQREESNRLHHPEPVPAKDVDVEPKDRPGNESLSAEHQDVGKCHHEWRSKQREHRDAAEEPSARHV